MLIEKLKAVLEKHLWQEPARAPRWRRGLLRPARILYAVVRDLADGQLNLRAMSLVYTTLLSLVPLLAITFSVLKGFGVHNQIEPLLLGVLAPLGEQGAEIATRIIEFVDKMQVGVLGSVGLVMLLYTVVSLIQKIEMALNAIWRIGESRSLATRFTSYISILVLGPILIFSTLGISATVSSSSAMQAISSVPGISFLLHKAGQLIPYIIIIFAFTLLYKFLPNTRVKTLSALVGGVVAGVLWETVGWAFAAYVVKSSNYPAIYSAFATLILFMVWLYVAWVILLIGASVSFYYQHPECIVARREELALSLRGQEQLALAVAAWIARCFNKAAPPPTLDDLVQRYIMPTVIIAATVKILEKGGFIRRVEGPHEAYAPSRPPETILATQILAAARDSGHERLSLSASLDGQPAVSQALSVAEAAADKALGGLTLKDLALDEGEKRA